MAVGPLYENYVAWAEANGHKRMTKNALSRRLCDYAPWGITSERTKASRFLRGITLQSLDLRMAQADAQAAG
jgi:hypothetical protein